jgi:hypothetical protein
MFTTVVGRYRRSRRLLGVLVLLLLACGLLYPIRVPAQLNYALRPSTPSLQQPGGFANPNFAFDATTVTFAGAAHTSPCHVECTTPHVTTTTWSGFPGGYIPTQLTVNWRASASYVLLNGTAAGSVEAKVEYSLNGGGSWQVLEQFSDTSPGNLSLSQHDVSITLPSNQDTALVQVRGTLTVKMTACASCQGVDVSNVTGGMYVHDIRINTSDCHVPSGENTASSGWHPTSPYRTTHNWLQTLTPPGPNVSFAGRKVTEQNPGGGGPDTCWFSGSQIPPQTSVTGGTWSVNSANQWGPDTVGWTEGAVSYYRGQGRAPCQTSFPQRMVINCGTGTRTYTTTLLRMGFDAAIVFSERAGTNAQRPWP